MTHQKPNMVLSPSPPADDSDIESLLMKRLMEPLSTPQTELPPSPDSTTPRKPVARLRSRRKRPRSETLSRFKTIRKAFTENSKAAQQTALALAVVRPQRTLTPSRNTPSASTPSASPTTSIVKVRELPQPPPRSTPKSSEKQPQQHAFTVDASHFVESHRREVGRFGSQSLHRRDRKKYQLAQLIKLGCRKPKGQKMPIGLLQEQRKRDKIRAQKKKQQHVASGMLLRSKRT